MVKKLLRRVLGRSALKYEEMCTVLCDVEAVINARPLTYLSEDVKDMTPLTPATFLQNNQSVGVPDLDHLDEVNLTKRYKYQQRLREEMRKRFREEYLRTTYTATIPEETTEADKNWRCCSRVLFIELFIWN